MAHLDEDWVREAGRLQGRYLVEVVEAFGLCPWAQRSRLDGQTRVSVVLARDEAALAPSIEVLDGWAGDDLEVGFLTYPRLKVGRHEFDGFVARLREKDAGRHGPGGAPFALAAFHPDAEPELADAERLIPLLRRTPDPCVQAVRMSALERVRRGVQAGTHFVDLATLEAALSEGPATPSLRDRIARANLDTVRRAGLQTLIASIEAIQHDRARTYQALEALELPPGATSH